jgi:hypothetical protein
VGLDEIILAKMLSTAYTSYGLHHEKISPAEVLLFLDYSTPSTEIREISVEIQQERMKKSTLRIRNGWKEKTRERKPSF